MGRKLRIQSKNQIEEIVILLHNIANKYKDELQQYETMKIDSIVTIGHCIYCDGYTKSIEMDIAQGKVYIENLTDKVSLNNKVKILYIDDNMLANLNKTKSDIIEQNNKMYENGIFIKKMLQNILKD